LVSYLVSAAGDLDFGLQLALWQIPKALEACASKADMAWVFDVPPESVMSRPDAEKSRIG